MATPSSAATMPKPAIRYAEKDRISTCRFADRVALAAIAFYKNKRGEVEYNGEQTVMAAFLVHDTELDVLQVRTLGVWF